MTPAGAKRAAARIKPARRSSPTAIDITRAAALYDALEACYPDARCELNFTNPHELLIATILSAQATDVSVNKATPELFRRFPTPRACAEASAEDIEACIRTIGLFRSKARAIREAMRRVCEVYDGRVPATMEDLLTLRGVARKTANVVLSNAFGVNEGVVVDTHVMRLSVRLGLARGIDARTPAALERRLMSLFPRERWGQLSHLLIFHGRRACKARPAGGVCSDHSVCASFGGACELRVSAPTAELSRRGRAGGDRPRIRRPTTARTKASERGTP